jgi:hypothetical protein
VSGDRGWALLVQRIAIFVLLLLFAVMLVGVGVAGVADPSVVLLPPIFAGVVGTVGLAVLLGAYGRGGTTVGGARRAVRCATVARSILVVGAFVVVVLGVVLGVVAGDGSVLLLGLGAESGPALAACVASTARGQFAAVRR